MPNHEKAHDGARQRYAVSAYFGRLAGTYGDGEYYSARRAAVIEALRSEILRAHRGLDLGCGNGRYLAEFRRLGAGGFFCGADFSPEMIAEARRYAGMPLLRADASILPFRERSFDLIFASHVLPFVSDIHTAAKDIARCLAPGGIVAVTVGGGGVRTAVEKVIGENEWRKLSGLMMGARGRRERDSVALHREALRDAGLELESRAASFEVSWAGVEEWVRLRWLPFATEAERNEASQVFSAIRACGVPGPFELHEELILGRSGSR